MIIDTHCHLNFYQFKNNWQEIIKKCLKNNFWLINVGCNLKSSQKAVEIASYFEKGVFSAVGIHPTDCQEEFRKQEFLKLLKNKKTVAIGEVGLDFWHLPFDKDCQKNILKKFLNLAQETKKLVIFHARNSKNKEEDAYSELLDVLDNYPDVRGIIHSYEGSFEQAQEFIKRGFYLGFNGLITKSKKSAKVAKKIPLENIVLETDSPYLLPFDAKGKINTPCNTLYVAQKLADLKKIDIKTIEKTTTKNALSALNLQL